MDEKKLGRFTELNEDELLGVSGGARGQTPPTSPQPSIPSIPQDPGLPSNSTLPGMPVDPAQLLGVDNVIKPLNRG